MMKRRWRNHHLAVRLRYQQILVFYWILLVTGESTTEPKHAMAVINGTHGPKQQHDANATAHLNKERKSEDEALAGADRSDNGRIDATLISSTTPSLRTVSDTEPSANVSETSIASSNESVVVVVVVASEANATSRETLAPAPSSNYFIPTESYSRVVRISPKSLNFSNSSVQRETNVDIDNNKNVTTSSSSAADRDAAEKPASDGAAAPHRSSVDDRKVLLTNSDALRRGGSERDNATSTVADKIPNDIQHGNSSHHVVAFNSSNIDRRIPHPAGKDTSSDYPDIVTNRTKMKNSTAAEVDARNSSSSASVVVTERVRPDATNDDAPGTTTSDAAKALTSSTNSEFPPDGARSASSGGGSEAIASERYATSNPTAQNVQSRGDPLGAGVIVGIICGVLGVAVVSGVFGYLLYHRRFRSLSEIKYPTDNCGYMDDTLRVSYINNHIELPKENSEEMFSLDNDSFLNSLEAMTLQNYWAEDAKNTKV